MKFITMNSEQYHYTGEYQDPKNPYLPDDGLKKAVKLAIYLQRPLLLQGEPGCGKTKLASALAYELGQRLNCSPYPYFPWSIKSTSQAKEGLYFYDSVGRLRDAQLVSNNGYEKYLKPEEIRALFDRLTDPEEYIKLGALGKAFEVENYRPVVLIDEIDKADIDFPNDLLRELEEKQFTVPELGGREYVAQQSPIILITSNREKDLPDAFLRRCIFYYIDFPDESRLIEIVQAHYPDVLENQDLQVVVEAAVAEFLKVRGTGTRRKDGKQASTSELLDFVGELKQHPKESALEMIKNLVQNVPVLGTLLKTKEDQDYYQQQQKQQQQNRDS
ncbi:AAA family ATPase [Spirulina subsalsa]|uniref:AAA family ATPase n=1 Tax=Spirulina subsalsa TaxID=54311 RepID=UPI00038174A2|nr:MoxR family ATPase [Spirulina subsalsa]